jgi:hypothetical protein
MSGLDSDLREPAVVMPPAYGYRNPSDDLESAVVSLDDLPPQTSGGKAQPAFAALSRMAHSTRFERLTYAFGALLLALPAP